MCEYKIQIENMYVTIRSPDCIELLLKISNRRNVKQTCPAPDTIIIVVLSYVLMCVMKSVYFFARSYICEQVKIALNTLV